MDEDALERAVQMLADQQKLVAEGAGAAGLAAMIAHPERFKGRRVGIVICGGNIDSRMLAQVLMRGLVREGRMVTLRIGISDAPGVLGTLAQLVGDSGGNIIEIHHQRMFNDLPVKRADVDAVIETRNPEHYREIVGVLEADGFPTRLLSNLSRSTDRSGRMLGSRRSHRLPPDETPLSRKDEMTAFKNVLEMIGKTPLVEVTRLDTGPCRCS